MNVRAEILEKKERANDDFPLVLMVTGGGLIPLTGVDQRADVVKHVRSVFRSVDEFTNFGTEQVCVRFSDQIMPTMGIKVGIMVNQELKVGDDAIGEIAMKTQLVLKRFWPDTHMAETLCVLTSSEELTRAYQQ